ncbi:effector-associated constant component EACC1 [Streptomyces sp. NPDC004561]
MPGGDGGEAVEIRSGHPDDLDAVYDELRGVTGLRVRGVPVAAAPGEQGSVLEFVTVACSGGAITILFQIVKTLVESRGSGITLTFRRGEDRLEVTAKNVEEVLPLLEKLFDDEG